MFVSSGEGRGQFFLIDAFFYSTVPKAIFQEIVLAPEWLQGGQIFWRSASDVVENRGEFFRTRPHVARIHAMYLQVVEQRGNFVRIDTDTRCGVAVGCVVFAGD